MDSREKAGREAGCDENNEVWFKSQRAFIYDFSVEAVAG